MRGEGFFRELQWPPYLRMLFSVYTRDPDRSGAREIPGSINADFLHLSFDYFEFFSTSTLVCRSTIACCPTMQSRRLSCTLQTHIPGQASSTSTLRSQNDDHLLAQLCSTIRKFHPVIRKNFMKKEIWCFYGNCQRNYALWRDSLVQRIEI